LLSLIVKIGYLLVWNASKV